MNRKLREMRVTMSYLSGFEIGYPGSIGKLTALWEANMLDRVDDMLVHRLALPADNNLFFGEDDMLFLLDLTQTKRAML